MRRTCDVIVIGGGPAGAAAALLLAKGGWSTIVVEKQRFPRAKVCGEYLSATNWPVLDRLGAAEMLEEQGGPSVRRVGLLAGRQLLTAALPAARQGPAWGRALGREKLDTWLLAAAARAGAEVLQPVTTERLELGSEDDSRRQHVCHARTSDGTELELSAPVVIAAHGSWGGGNLPTSVTEREPAASDLFGFKAHFHRAALPEDLMPLVCFPAGYGGMVHSDDGRVSLSCCIRRDKLAALKRSAGQAAGTAVLAHILNTTPAAATVLGNAQLADHWLAAGPIRPGIRWRYRRGVFRLGNVAGEAHPAVAEGISMALQSATLAVECLIQAGRNAPSTAIDRAGRHYSTIWKRQFAGRLRMSALVAHWAMRPALVTAALPLLGALPALLTWGAYQSGKSKPLVFMKAVP